MRFKNYDMVRDIVAGVEDLKCLQAHIITLGIPDSDDFPFEDHELLYREFGFYRVFSFLSPDTMLARVWPGVGPKLWTDPTRNWNIPESERRLPLVSTSLRVGGKYGKTVKGSLKFLNHSQDKVDLDGVTRDLLLSEDPESAIHVVRNEKHIWLEFSVVLCDRWSAYCFATKGRFFGSDADQSPPCSRKWTPSRRATHSRHTLRLVA